MQCVHHRAEDERDIIVKHGRWVAVVLSPRAFIAREIVTRGERVGLKRLQRIAERATDIAAVRVFRLDANTSGRGF
jgi:hypothetical protein